MQIIPDNKNIFTRPNACQFLYIVSEAIGLNIKLIYDCVRVKYYSDSDAKFLVIYQWCLQTINRWCPKTKEQEFSMLKIRYPHLEYLYQYTYFTCLRNIAGSRQCKMKRKYSIPTLEYFLYLFYTRAILEPSIVDATWFKCDQKTSSLFFCNILEKVFVECIFSITFAGRSVESPQSVVSLSFRNLESREDEYNHRQQKTFLQTAKQLSERQESEAEQDLEPEPETEPEPEPEPEPKKIDSKQVISSPNVVNLIDDTDELVSKELNDIVVNNSLDLVQKI